MPSRSISAFAACIAVVMFGLVALSPSAGHAQPGTFVGQSAAGAGAATVAGAPGESVPTFGSFGRDEAGGAAVIGEIAIDLRDDVSPSDVAAVARDHGIAMRPNSAWSTTHDKIEVADVDPAREPALIDELSRDPRVEHAEPMSVFHATFVPNDPLYESRQWHLKRVGAEDAWSYTCGRGVTVAVIDTGIACFDKGPFSRGTDLSGTRCEGGWNFVDDKREASDDQGHGTHVAGTIAQTTNNGVGAAGLAFCASLMPVKVLNKQGFGSVANIAEGVRFAADAGAQIINLSLGGPIRSRILEDAVNYALSSGVVVVAAAGNSGGRVGWPAAYPGVIAVSATDDKDKLAAFSSRGPEVAIAAPGVRVTQQTVCNGGRDRCELFGTFNGTSMASPHVAGVAAMIEALGVTRGSAVRATLLASARSVGDGDRDAKLFGAGIVDAARATSHVFWRHLGLRLLALAGLFGLVRRHLRARRRSMSVTAGVVFGAALAGVGLLPFAPVLGLVTRGGPLGRVVELAMRPLGEWDIVLTGVSSHRWLLLASALPALALAALGFANRHMRPLVGGVALGTAAFLVQTVWSGDAAFVAGPFLGSVWAVANALVCVWLARLALEARV